MYGGLLQDRTYVLAIESSIAHSQSGSQIYQAEQATNAIVKP